MPEPPAKRPRPITFDAFPRDYDPKKEPIFRFYRVVRLFEQVVGKLPGKDSSWLDLGCHSGSLLRCAIALYGVEGMGVDVYDEAHKNDKVYECFQRSENPWTYKKLNIDSEFELGRKFDVISALEVIEHMDDTDRFLDNCRRHLNPGGHLVISTPNINNLINRVRVPLGLYPIGMEYRTIVHHVRLYNPAMIRKHLEEKGFRVKGLTGVKLLPGRRSDEVRLLRVISEKLADLLPGLAPNIIVIAKKVKE